jgi:outer membrane protein assembly factor BamD (BamD/ComL family)
MIRLLISLLLTVWCLSGCAGLRLQSDEFTKADQLVSEKKYNDAVAVYETIAKEDAGTKRGANATFSAAKTRACYDNPHRDYSLALQLFEEFLRKYPNDEQVRDAHQWRYFLKTLLELKKENERLNQNIEQLKKIDIKHEERRRK